MSIVQPDVTLLLDMEGRITAATLANDCAEERVDTWLGRPGADLAVLLNSVRRQGGVRLFATRIQGELGTETEVELSVVAYGEGDPPLIGVWLRDVSRRLAAPDPGTLLASLPQRLGRTSLRQLVADSVSLLERHYIEAALKLTGGNRTAAAELLGLSRQSLYDKLMRYGRDGGSSAAERPD